jgi:hypothetical protein
MEEADDTNEDESLSVGACILDGADGSLPLVKGQVCGRDVKVLRDTGCSGAILNKKYCPAAKLTGKHIIVHQIHANPLRVPVAEVYVDTPYYKGKLKVAVLDTIISDLIIGNVKGVKCIREPHYGCEC